MCKKLNISPPAVSGINAEDKLGKDVAILIKETEENVENQNIKA
ncbi:hypothetical protein PRVXT_002487 [Proteinivorax tanatarense]|uniref:Uncharacterized protein n=1 Tax=Proteinivorax tanatarense TaxID=1260629 RepID=A0AAU7VKM4_9FIRM